MHLLGLHLRGFMKKIFTDLKAYNIADLSSYSYGINKNIAFIMA